MALIVTNLIDGVLIVVVFIHMFCVKRIENNILKKNMELNEELIESLGTEVREAGEYIFGIKAISDFNNKIVSKEKEIKAKISNPIYPPQKIAFKNLNDTCTCAINCGMIIQKFNFKMTNDQHEDIFINHNLDITQHITTNNRTIDKKGNPIFKIEKNVHTNDYFLYLSEFLDQSYIGNYFLAIIATSVVDKNITTKKLIEIKIIEGLEYKEDGITYIRKNQKDDWIVTNIDDNVCEIRWEKDKKILGKKIKGFENKAAVKKLNL